MKYWALKNEQGNFVKINDAVILYESEEAAHDTGILGWFDGEIVPVEMREIKEEVGG